VYTFKNIFKINLINMAKRIIKAGMNAEAIDAGHTKVKEIVNGILDDVRRNGSEAVHRLSEKFDGWNPQQFRLSEDQIEKIISTVSERTMTDLKWAQAQVRRFAQIQKSTLRDVEIETMPGVILGHKNIPVNSVGCYIPGGRYPMVASAHMSVLTAKVGRCKTGDCLHPS
jgi:sulfopropanediol 3-dehydrogenase